MDLWCVLPKLTCNTFRYVVDTDDIQDSNYTTDNDNTGNNNKIK